MLPASSILTHASAGIVIEREAKAGDPETGPLLKIGPGPNPRDPANGLGFWENYVKLTARYPARLRAVSELIQRNIDSLFGVILNLSCCADKKRPPEGGQGRSRS